MVNSSQIIQSQSIRLLLAIYISDELDVWTVNIHQAYLQTYVALQRDVIVEMKNLNLKMLNVLSF